MTNSTRGAPDFILPRLDGLPWEYPLDARGRPLLLVFFETDCPTCLLTLPYLNRLEEALGDTLLIVAISQDSPGATKEIIQSSRGRIKSGALRVEFVMIRHWRSHPETCRSVLGTRSSIRARPRR